MRTISLSHQSRDSFDQCYKEEVIEWNRMLMNNSHPRYQI